MYSCIIRNSKYGLLNSEKNHVKYTLSFVEFPTSKFNINLAFIQDCIIW